MKKIFIILLTILFFTSCKIERSYYTIEQEISEYYNEPTLVTYLWKRHRFPIMDNSILKSWADPINPNTPNKTDSIKCLRYKEAKKLGDEFQRIEKLKCN